MALATAAPKPTRKRNARPAAEAPAPETTTPPVENEAPEDGTDQAAEAPEAGDSGETRQIATGASRTLSIPGVQAQFTERSLVLPEKMTLKNWVKVVDAIDGVREGARWWFGDAIIAGEARFGETYAQAMDATKYDYSTLRNLRTVANRYKPADRIYNLSWSHYRAAMGVPLDVAREVLAIAERDDWSTAQLFAHVKEIKSNSAGTGQPITNNGRTANPPTTQSATPSVMPGIQPVADIAAAEAAGTQLYECGGCPNVFDQQVWHCVGCQGHWPMSVDECPNEQCGQTDATADQATDPTPVPLAIGGTVITPAETGADQALTVLLSFPFSDLDPSDIAASLAGSDAFVDPLASLMAAHNWIGQVIEAMAEADDEPEAPGRDAEIEAEETEDDDDLGGLDLGDDDESEDDENGSDDDDSDSEADDEPEAPESQPTAAQSTPRATARARAAAPATAPASRPISPAPKPGAGKPVRRRATAAAE